MANVVLDLDETVISGVDPEDVEGLLSGDIEELEKYVAEGGFVGHTMGSEYVIVERPGLQDFLDYLFAHFRVSVFTAASPHYGAFIVDNIILQGKPERVSRFAYFLARPHFKKSKELYGVPKDLRLLWEHYGVKGMTPENTVLLDDLEDARSGKNRCNVIAVKKFSMLSGSRERYLEETVRPKLERYLEHWSGGSGGMCLLDDMGDV